MAFPSNVNDNTGTEGVPDLVSPPGMEPLAFRRRKVGEMAAGFAAMSRAVSSSGSFSRLPDES